MSKDGIGVDKHSKVKAEQSNVGPWCGLEQFRSVKAEHCIVGNDRRRLSIA